MDLKRAQALAKQNLALATTNQHLDLHYYGRGPRRGSPRVRGGVFKRPGLVRLVESLEMTSGLDYNNQPPCFIDPLVRDRRPIYFTGPLRNSPHDFNHRRFNRAFNYSSLYFKSRPLKLSFKVKDPLELTDGQDLTFFAQRKLLLSKFFKNSDHFCSDTEKMAYIFGNTGGTA